MRSSHCAGAAGADGVRRLQSSGSFLLCVVDLLWLHDRLRLQCLV